MMYNKTCCFIPSLSVSFLDCSGSETIKTYINSFRERIQHVLNEFIKMASEQDKKIEEVKKSPSGSNLSPRVSYMHFTPTKFTYKHRRYLIDIVTLDHRHLKIVHIMRSTLAKLIYNARKAAILKRIKNVSESIEIKNFDSIYNEDEITKELLSFPKYTPGIYGSLWNVVVDNSVPPRTGLLYQEGDFFHLFLDAYLEFLEWTCDACGAYAQEKCHLCNYRYCSNACKQARPDQHTIHFCPL